MPALSPTRRNALLLVVLLFAQLLLMAGSSRDAEGATMLINAESRVGHHHDRDLLAIAS